MKPSELYKKLLKTEKNTKYGNKKVTIDGIQFDSKLESDRYCELKLLQRGGKISDLRLQPIYLLQESFKRENKTIKAINYIGDFEYIEKGQVVVEDTKGFKTKEYLIKKKLLLYKYPEMDFREIER